MTANVIWLSVVWDWVSLLLHHCLLALTADIGNVDSQKCIDICLGTKKRSSVGSKEPRNLGKGDVQGFQLSGSQDCQGCWFKMQTPTLLRDSNSKKTDAHGPRMALWEVLSLIQLTLNWQQEPQGRLILKRRLGVAKRKLGARHLNRERRQTWDLATCPLASLNYIGPSDQTDIK